MKFKRVFYFYILFFLGAALAFGFGYLTRSFQDLAARPEFPILDQAYDILTNHAYDDLPESPALEYGMIRGMVQAYGDPYTRFEEPVQHELSSDSLHGSYGGIGANLGQDPEGHIILHPFPDGPAAKAGVLDGDRLMRVADFVVLPDTPMDEVVAAIRGPAGERVEIEVARPPDDETQVFKIKRQEIPLPSVTWNIEPAEPRLGSIQINRIAASTPDEIETAIDDLTQRGATHFLLDLRGNRGGLLTAGVDIARLFLSEGIIIQEQYRGQEVESYRTEKPGPFEDLPLVVLINADTASAAEITAGALQAHQRAPLIGTPTFGKDSIQLIFNLDDGSSLHVTSARWWVPGLATPIGEGGLQPDISVTPEEAEGDPFLLAATRFLFGH